MGDRLQASTQYAHVTSQLGRLSLADGRPGWTTSRISPWCCLIEYQLRLAGWGKGGNVTSVGWPCDPTWHVSSRSGVAGQTAYCYIHILYFTLLSN